MLTEATLHVPFASMEQPHVLEQNGISTFQICALAWWDSNPSLEKTSLIRNPCLTAEQGRKGWEEVGGSKRQRETLLSSRGRHTTHRIHDGSAKIFDPKDVPETTSA